MIDLRKRNEQLEMEVDILKQAALIMTKINVIEQNRHKYSVSAMCKVLQIARSTFYYDTGIAAQKKHEKVEVEEE